MQTDVRFRSRSSRMYHLPLIISEKIEMLRGMITRQVAIYPAYLKRLIPKERHHHRRPPIPQPTSRRPRSPMMANRRHPLIAEQPVMRDVAEDEDVFGDVGPADLGPPGGDERADTGEAHRLEDQGGEGVGVVDDYGTESVEPQDSSDSVDQLALAAIVTRPIYTGGGPSSKNLASSGSGVYS